MTSTSPSIRDFDSVADRIRLHRQVKKGPVVVVEGASDQRFLERSTDLQADIFIASTRGLVLVAARALADMRISQVACLVDRDFDDVVADAVAAGLPVVAYDNADLEAMLIGTDALDALLDEVASEAKLNSFGGAPAVRHKVDEATRPIAQLRYRNSQHNWGLTFDQVAVVDKLDGTTLMPKQQAFCDALWAASTGRSSSVTKQAIYQAFTQTVPLNCPNTGRSLFRGRDGLSVISRALRRQLASLSRAQADVERLAATLRLACNASDFSSSPWMVRMQALLR